MTTLVILVLIVDEATQPLRFKTEYMQIVTCGYTEILRTSSF